jgi:hypothetical protein
MAFLDRLDVELLVLSSFTFDDKILFESSTRFVIHSGTLLGAAQASCLLYITAITAQ